VDEEVEIIELDDEEEPPVVVEPGEDEVEVDDLDEQEEEDDVDSTDFAIHIGGDLYASVNSGLENVHYELKSTPAHGTINFYGNGEFDFHAVPGFSGTVSFQYAVTAANGSVTIKEAAISIQGISPGYGDHVDEPADNGQDEVEVVEVDEEEYDNNNCDNHYGNNNVCDNVQTVVSCFDGILDTLFDCEKYTTPTYCKPTYTSYNSSCDTSYKSSYSKCYTTSYSKSWSWGSLWGGWCW
jgi:hypothetical protein